MNKKILNPFNHAFIILFAIILFISAAHAVPSSNAKISGRIIGGVGYQLFLVKENGEILKSTTLSSSEKFNFNVNLIKATKASLFLGKDGQGVGPVVLKKISTTKSSIFFSGKTQANKNNIRLGRIDLKEGYANVRKNLNSSIVSKIEATAVDGVPIGAGNGGLVAATTPTKQFRGGRDSDNDGYIDIFDLDLNGNRIANPFDTTDEEEEDEESLGGPGILAAEGVDMPFTTLFLNMNQTLNVNVGSVTLEDIDAVISGENGFAIVFFFKVDDTTYDGAHVICDSSLLYCRSEADGGSTSIIGGVSESTTPPSGVWSSFNDDGSGFPNLDLISGFQGQNENVFVGSVQPRVTTSQFQPGDLATIEFMNGTTVSERRAISIPSYFVTIPALQSYNAGSGVQTVDYDTPPGSSEGSPITLTGGTFTATFWRPQRLSIGEETGSFRDISALQYGLIISTQTKEFGCSDGLFSGLSSLDTTGSNSLWPLRDTVTVDAEPNAANTLSFTVNLSACLAENGATAGTYTVNLTAAGAQVTGGRNRAAQSFFLAIP
ncbi:MAG: hypothetical protein SGJ02_09105 [bacterium]|nr:hypothetical protein [bacterium]